MKTDTVGNDASRGRQLLPFPGRSTGFVIVFLWSVWAAAAPQRGDCAGACHADQRGHRFGHRLPVAKCGDCHLSIEPKPGTKPTCRSGHAFKLKEAQPHLCLQCHEVQKKTELHGAIVAGGCTRCHSPHGGDNVHLLNDPNITELCTSCHEEGTGENIHGAITQKTCLGCHDPHSGVEKPLLTAPADALCATCHDIETKLLGAMRYKHQPAVQRQCTACHDPHASEHRALLLTEPNTLCSGCHDAATSKRPQTDFAAKTIRVNAKVKHAAIEKGTCLDCHRPHASKYSQLQVKPQPALCHDCHPRQDVDPFVHSALRLGQCSGCHEPHSNDNKKMLRGKAPTDTCFVCHADDLTTRAHVHYPAKTDCMNCHDPHGSENERNLKQSGKAVCYDCHQPVDAEPVKHGAIERYGCHACHDPHGAKNRAYLVKPINEVCLSCHPKIDKFHVPGAPMGHKLQGGPDPKRRTRDFSCVSCHTPHSGRFEQLLHQGGQGMESCTYCHLSGGSRVDGNDNRPPGSPGPLPLPLPLPSPIPGEAAN